MKRLLNSLLALTVLAAFPAAAADIARYILPPGNFGGLPSTANSTRRISPNTVHSCVAGGAACAVTASGSPCGTFFASPTNNFKSI